jgi:hypothetical protein
VFTSYPTYPKYRALRLTDPLTRGEDVYALQCALNEVNHAGLATDGVLGKASSSAIKAYQLKKAQTDPTIGDADGIAGTLTQRALTLDVCHLVSSESGVRFAALKGQTEFESGFRPGIYSDLHNPGTTKQSWDSGVAQENSLVFPVQRAFTPLSAVRDLVARIVEYRDQFGAIAGDRRLQLAQGCWNAPAWACHIAYEEGATTDWVKARRSLTLTDAQRAAIEDYMAHVAVYYI